MEIQLITFWIRKEFGWWRSERIYYMQKYKIERRPITKMKTSPTPFIIYAIMSDVFQICLSTCSIRYKGLEMTYSIEFIIQDDSYLKILFLKYAPKEYTLLM
jgi:hypothetical protein